MALYRKIRDRKNDIQNIYSVVYVISMSAVMCILKMYKRFSDIYTCVLLIYALFNSVIPKIAHKYYTKLYHYRIETAVV